MLVSKVPGHHDVLISFRFDYRPLAPVLLFMSRVKAAVLCAAILIFGMASFTVEAAKPDCTDADNDTYSINGKSCGPVDCNDDNKLINPDAAEICNDTIDNNCDSLIDSAGHRRTRVYPSSLHGVPARG